MLEVSAKSLSSPIQDIASETDAAVPPSITPVPPDAAPASRLLLEVRDLSRKFGNVQPWTA